MKNLIDWQIIVAMPLTVLCEFLRAEQINSMWKAPEDEFIPRKWKKLGFPFLFLPKKVARIRWRAYWLHRLTQIHFCIAVLILVLGRFLTGSFDFWTNTILSLYPLLIVLSNSILETTTFIYVKIKKAKKSKTS